MTDKTIIVPTVRDVEAWRLAAEAYVMNDEGTDTGSDGMRAREAGRSVEDCPYKPSPQRTAWVTGWWIAERPEAKND